MFCANRGRYPSFALCSCTVNFSYLALNSHCFHLPVCCLGECRDSFHLVRRGRSAPIPRGGDFYDFICSGSETSRIHRVFFSRLSACGPISSKKHREGGVKIPITSGLSFRQRRGFDFTFRGDDCPNCYARGLIRTFTTRAVPVC